MTRGEIIHLFSNYGTLLGCSNMNEKGYAFVQYANSTEADYAVAEANGYLWKGHKLGT